MQCECAENENCVRRLKTISFSSGTFQEKTNIITIGRPTPSLNIVQQRKTLAGILVLKFTIATGGSRDVSMTTNYFAGPVFYFVRKKMCGLIQAMRI